MAPADVLEKDAANRSARPEDDLLSSAAHFSTTHWARGPPLANQGANLPPPLPYALRMGDAVAYSGLGKSFLYDSIRRGQLTSVKVAGRRLVLREDLENLIHGRTRAEPNP
jgi:hypothetical protein